MPRTSPSTSPADPAHPATTVKPETPEITENPEGPATTDGAATPATPATTGPAPCPQRAAQGAGGRPARRRRAPELLAPAGSFDAFKAAVAAGADAVYCGQGAFNARRNADNLDAGAFGEACRLAHLAGSRVYVTVNILIREDELPDALRLVHACIAAGADAFIVQDWGLLRAVHELWPRAELHLSTQANVHEPRGVRFARDRGCSRVTLSRELSLAEIEACSHEGVELEVFGHGALCVCYSGECLLSSFQRGRSANRGLCRQPCRLPYRLLDDAGADVSRAGGTRLLSPRDNCTAGMVAELAEAGCASLKIEGRMKAPDYVGTVVGCYREALDEYARGGDPKATPEVVRTLARAFNRDFTNAYLHGESGPEMMSYERGNNRGQLAGAVSSAVGRRATVALDEPVGAGDLLEVRDPDAFDDYVTVPAPRDCEAGGSLPLDLPRPMRAGCPVRVIRSEEGMARARAYAVRKYPRKRRVDVRVTARLGSPLSIELSTVAGDCHPALGDGVVRVAVEGATVEAARTKSLTVEDVVEHVGRFGTSPFEVAGWDVGLDEGVGMGFSALHALRARAAETLERAILEPWEARAREAIEPPCSLDARRAGDGRARRAAFPAAGGPAVCALVTSPAAARAARDAGAGVVYAPADDLVLGPGSSGRRDLAEGGADDWPEDVVPLFDEVGREADVRRLEGLFAQGSEAGVGTVGWLALAVERGCAPWVWNTLPLHNHVAFEEMRRAGAAGAWLSPELELMEVAALAAVARLPLGIVVYGHQRTMTTEHCVLQAMGPCARACAACDRRSGRLTLRDEFDRPSLVTSDALGRSRLWQAGPLDATPQVPELLGMGVTRFMVDTRLLSRDEAARAVARTVRALEAAAAGRAPDPREPGANPGHLFERIG